MLCEPEMLILSSRGGGQCSLFYISFCACSTKTWNVIELIPGNRKFAAAARPSFLLSFVCAPCSCLEAIQGNACWALWWHIALAVLLNYCGGCVFFSHQSNTRDQWSGNQVKFDSLASSFQADPDHYFLLLTVAISFFRFLILTHPLWLSLNFLHCSFVYI